MALLDMARKNLSYIEVGHVNHHHRDTAKRDENIVRRYCKKYNIKFHLLNLKPEKAKGNFQAYAREERYKFFSRICKRNDLYGVMIAHHKDDLIETYLMQVNKKLGVDYYGLAKKTFLYDVIVDRPLLGFTKNELIKYCHDNSVEYGIDESNKTNAYERNRIRHSKVEKMSDAEKNEMVKIIDKLNQKVYKDTQKAIACIDKKQDFKVQEFLKIPNLKYALRFMFGSKSDKFFDEMLRQIKTSNKYLYCDDIFWISKEYDMVHIFMKPLQYEYHFNNLKELKSKRYLYFKIAKKGESLEGVSLNKDDFPITIRNCKESDKIKMLYGTKKINRFFIDNKILIKDRLTWPIVTNKKGIAILVPGIGCNKDHYSKKHNLYVLKYEYSEGI